MCLPHQLHKQSSGHTLTILLMFAPLPDSKCSPRGKTLLRAGEERTLVSIISLQPEGDLPLQMEIAVTFVSSAEPFTASM